MQKRWLWAIATGFVLGCTGAAEFVEARNPVPPDAPNAAGASSPPPLPSSPLPTRDAGAPQPDAAP